MAKVTFTINGNGLINEATVEQYEGETEAAVTESVEFARAEIQRVNFPEDRPKGFPKWDPPRSPLAE